MKKLLQLEQLANLSTYLSKRFNSFCYDDDDDEDYTIAVTPSLSTEEPDNFSIGDEHLDTILERESDEFIKSSVKNFIPIPSESEGIPDNMCDVPFHDNSPPLDVSKDQFEDFYNSNDEFSSTDDDSFSIDNIDYVEASPPDSELIESLNDNPIPSFDFMTKSSSTSLNSLLEETNTYDNSLPEFETFCFDVEEISSEYDCFFFKIEPNSGDSTMDVVKDISPTREPRVHNALPTHPTLHLNMKFKLSSDSFFTYVVWIFLPFLLYSVAPQYLLSLGNEDSIFDPGICNYHFFGQVYLIGVELSQDPKSCMKVRWRSYLPLAPPWTHEFGVESGSRLG
nr:hypothetical protein [Tanacetum cinerariifolium]